MNNDNLSNMFYDFGNTLTKHQSCSEKIGLRRFKSFFGVSPSICAKTWNLIKSKLPSDCQPIHLLWTLLFLKCYNTESVNHSIAGCDEKTFRKRVNQILDHLMSIKVVSVYFFSCKCRTSN